LTSTKVGSLFKLKMQATNYLKSYLGSADYLTGASNSRKRSRDSPARTGQPLDGDAEVEDAGEK
jgi:hypothetical protein